MLNSFTLNLLESIGYKYDHGLLIDNETGEIASSPASVTITKSSSDLEDIIDFYKHCPIKGYHFKNAGKNIDRAVYLVEKNDEKSKNNLITFYTPKMGCYIDNRSIEDKLDERKIIFKTENGPTAILSFHAKPSNDFQNITTTTISCKNSDGITPSITGRIFSDLQELKYLSYDLQGNFTSLGGVRLETADISEDAYFAYILDNLKLIFGSSIDEQEYDIMKKVISGLSDNVKVMLDLQMIESQAETVMNAKRTNDNPKVNSYKK